MQLDLQALSPQVNGKQLAAAGTQQVPAPSQVPAPVKVAPGTGQEAFEQAVPDGYFWQAPAWHLPSVPQEVGPWSAHRASGSGSPVGTGVHEPMLPLIAQETHEPVQALAQQTPCAQCWDWHSVPVEQNAPLGLVPHEPWTQAFPVAQALSLPQAV